MTTGLPFRTRLFVYLALWTLAALAFEILLKPLGLTETDQSDLHQRLTLPLYTPLISVAGLVFAFTWPNHHGHYPAHWPFWAALLVYVSLGILLLTRSRRRAVVLLSLAQALILVVSVIYFVRYTKLPGPG